MLIPSMACAATPYDEFSGDPLDGKWTEFHYQGTTSIVVSGGECRIRADKDTDDVAVAGISVDNVSLPFDCFVKFRTPELNSVDGGSDKTWIWIGEAGDFGTFFANGSTKFVRRSNGIVSRKDTVPPAAEDEGATQSHSGYDPLYVWVNITAGGTITLKFKVALTDDWTVISPPADQFDLDGENTFEIFFGTFSGRYEWTTWLDYIQDTDPTPESEPTNTHNPWHGFISWEGFSKW